MGLGSKNKQGRNIFAPVGANTFKVANIPNPCPASAANGEGQRRRAQLAASVQVQASGGGGCRASSPGCWRLGELLSLLAWSFGLFAADRREELCSVSRPFPHCAALSLLPGRLGRVCGQPGARLLTGRPVHQPRGLLHLPLPDGPGRQPRPSWPGLCRRVRPLRPRAPGRAPAPGPGCGVRPASPPGRMGTVLRAQHTVRNPQKHFHFNFFNHRN